MGLGEIIAANEFRFNKRYGQNFITDANLLKAIVSDAGITDCDTVLEIGSGAGTLTACIADKAKRVVSYEIDVNLKPILTEALMNYGNVEVIYGDFLEVSIAELTAKLGERFKVVANLPYYITTPVIMRLIENGLGESLTIMVQEEVAARLAAAPGSKEYGAITAQINLVGDVMLLRKVPRYMFTPRPNVDSAVIKISLRRKFQEDIVKITRPLIAAAFSCRRKTLANNLMQSLGLSREKATRAIALAGFIENIRGEKLSAESFTKLAKIISNEV